MTKVCRGKQSVFLLATFVDIVFNRLYLFFQLYVQLMHTGKKSPELLLFYRAYDFEVWEFHHLYLN